jgi:hypothetical protein
VKGKVGVIMAGKNQRENMDWVMSELDLHHVKERDVEVHHCSNEENSGIMIYVIPT